MGPRVRGSDSMGPRVRGSPPPYTPGLRGRAQEDVRDGLDGAEGQGVAATVHSRVEGKGTGLALWEVGWADASCGSLFQEVVTVICAGSKAQAIDVQAGDLDRDHSLEHQVERHGGSSGER